jgi:hypothetical protein
LSLWADRLAAIVEDGRVAKVISLRGRPWKPDSNQCAELRSSETARWFLLPMSAFASLQLPSDWYRRATSRHEALHAKVIDAVAELWPVRPACRPSWAQNDSIKTGTCTASCLRRNTPNKNFWSRLRRLFAPVNQTTYKTLNLRGFREDQISPDEIDDAIHVLFAKSANMQIKRLGLRYSNAFRPEVHQISGIHDLDISIVSGDTISGNMNLNYTMKLASDMLATIRMPAHHYYGGLRCEKHSVQSKNR